MRSARFWAVGNGTAHGLMVALVALAVSSSSTPASYAQASCVEPEPVCDKWWDANTSAYIQNPDCAYLNHGYLQSNVAASGPSEGYRVNPVGKICGVNTGGYPCGVRTTTNTCAESTGGPPVYCAPDDPTCFGGDPCDPTSPAWDPYLCRGPFVYSAGKLDGNGKVDGKGGSPVKPTVRSPRGSAGLATTLRKATLASPLPKSVSNLLEALSRATGIYVKARITFANSAEHTKSVGTYEYWERGGLYRIRLDSALGYPWSDMAFDGVFLQGQMSVDAVEIRRGDERLTPFPHSPLALALAPLRVGDWTECRLCQLRLADLKQAMDWRRKASAGLAASESVINTGAFDAGALRTGETDAEGRLVRLLWPPDETNGRQLEVTLSDYQPLGGTCVDFPMTLTESLIPERSVTYAIENIDLSPSFPDEVFNIRTKARKILYGYFDANGSWHGRYVKWEPTPGPCDMKKPH